MIDLNLYKRKVYSQDGEDGILEKIFQTLNIKKGWFCEFGAADGFSYCNTRKLREEGWGGVLIEGSPVYCDDMKKSLADFKNLEIIESYISCENGERLDDILLKTKLPKELDFMCIDVDGNDVWIWESLSNYNPKVVMVEYNSNFPSESSMTIEYNRDHRHELDSYYGGTAGAFYKLAKKKGYELVAFTQGLNLVFCKKEIADSFVIKTPSEIPRMVVWPTKNKHLIEY